MSGKFKTGLDNVPKDDNQNGENVFLRWEDMEIKTLVSQAGKQDVTIYYQHSFWDIKPPIIFPCEKNNECPGCKAGNRAVMRAVLPVEVIDEEGGRKSKLWAMSKTVANTLQETIEMSGVNLESSRFKVKRSGTGLNTEYRIVLSTENAKITLEPLEPIEYIRDYSISEKLEMLFEAGFLSEPESEINEDFDNTEDWD